MTPPAGPVTGARVWIGAALVVVAVLSGAWTIRPLVQGTGWYALTAVVVLLVALVAAGARSVCRSWWAPSAWAAGATTTAVAVLFAGPDRLTVPLPTVETLRALRRVADSGVQGVVDGYIPVPASRGIEMLLVVGVLVVLLVADGLALGAGRPALAGLPLLGLWSVGVVFELAPSALALLLGATSFLLLLSQSRPGRRRQERGALRDGVVVGAVAASVTVLAIALGPLVSAAPFWGTVRLPTTWGEGAEGGPTELSVDLDMRASLGRRSERTLMTYTTDGPAAGPLRLYTLTSFDGRQWREETPSGTPQDVDGTLWPDSAARDAVAAAGDDATTLRIQVGDLDGDRLPLPVEPREVFVPGGDWSYDPVRDEVSADRATTRSLDYEVQVAPRPLSEDVLRQDDVERVAPDSPYLQLPDTSAAADVRALTEEITADARTTYDRLLAIQSYLRDASRFRYDTRVPPARTDDAVMDFLTDRTGYCVQYATAMTVMARHLGIPTRMGVGFLPGRASVERPGLFEVTGRLAHTWPEVWFADAGWVRFEPTPAAQTGAPPVYADPFAEAQTGPSMDIPTAAATAPAGSAPSTAPQAPGAGQGEVSLGRAQVPLGLVVGVGALLVVLTVVAALRVRRGPPPPAPTGAGPTWDRLRERLGALDVRWSDALTPRQAAGVVREAHGVMHPDTDAALRSLVAALEEERYAPHPRPQAQEDLDRWVELVVSPLEERARQPRQAVPVG